MFKKPSSEITPETVSKESVAAIKDDIETVVGPSVCVEGDFASEGRILVKGIVSGNVKTSKLLTVEEGAKILANVKAGEAVISGQVKGNSKINGRLELTATAQIEGDVACRELIVAGGALIHGKVVMKGINIEDSKEKKRGLRSSKVADTK